MVPRELLGAMCYVDDGLLQLPLGDLEFETDAEGPCVIGSKYNNRLKINLKIRLQSEKKKTKNATDQIRSNYQL